MSIEDKNKSNPADIIRFPDTNAAQIQSMNEQQKNWEEAKKLDAIRLKLEEGGFDGVSTEELQTLNSVKEKSLEDKTAETNETDTKKSEESQSNVSNDEEIKKYDALISKIEKNESLTKEEEELASKLLETPINIDKVYKVGGKEYKFKDMLDKMAEEFGKSVYNIPSDVLVNIVDAYYDKFSKQEWQKAQTRRDQELSKSRRGIGEVTLRLLNASETLKENLIKTENLLKQVKALASQDINPESIYDEEGKIDPIKQYHLTKVLIAKEQLPEIEKEYNSLKERSVQTELELAVQKFRDFQEAYPQYKTSQDVMSIIENRGNGTLPEEDEDKFIEMLSIFQEANAAKVNPEKIYNRRLRLNQLAVKPSVQEEMMEASKFTKNNNQTEMLLEKLKSKKAAILSVGAGKTTMSNNKNDKKKAAETIRASSMAVYSSNNKDLIDLGY